VSTAFSRVLVVCHADVSVIGCDTLLADVQCDSVDRRTGTKVRTAPYGAGDKRTEV
jgi:hypothetical protein